MSLRPGSRRGAGDPDNETLEYRENLMNGFPESRLPERFSTDEFQVLALAQIVL